MRSEFTVETDGERIRLNAILPEELVLAEVLHLGHKFIYIYLDISGRKRQSVGFSTLQYHVELPGRQKDIGARVEAHPERDFLHLLVRLLQLGAVRGRGLGLPDCYVLRTKKNQYSASLSPSSGNTTT